MTHIALVHPNETVRISVRHLLDKCDLFKRYPTLAGPSYRIASSVALHDFREFVSALEGETIPVTSENEVGLRHLCEEFGFSDLLLPTPTSQKDISYRLTALESSYSKLTSLPTKITSIQNDIDRLRSEVQTFSQRLDTQFQSLRDSVDDEFERVYSDFPDPYYGGPPRVVGGGPAVRGRSSSKRISPSTPDIASIKSKILVDFPEIFSQFRGKTFQLLWDGHPGDFKGSSFHQSCNNKANTLTIMRDSDGNVFGGFTPAMWVRVPWTCTNHCKEDESGESWLFTLVNPHGLPPRKFPLKLEQKHRALYCQSTYGPAFGGEECELAISEGTRMKGVIGKAGPIGEVYSNDTGNPTPLTQRQAFELDYVEVFQIM
jgi:hypothetical protein